MRFERIDILRYGHLSDVRLSFASAQAAADGGAALHVIYGPNEAGKSTTLRAITGLLYGIPDRTADAHLHGKELRVAAVLRDGDGRRLAVQRRKGRKNTLLDAASNPIAEAELSALLGGVSEAVFTSTFGLDHERLRQGGEALLTGGGAVGESLLTAAVGGRAVHAVLEALRAEADGLFKPRAHKPQLNLAIAAFREAKKRATREGLRPDDWVEQKRAVETLRATLAELDAQRRALATERGELQRAVDVLPLLAKRGDLQSRLAAVADALLLPAGFAQERETLQRELRECEKDGGQQRAAIERLRAQLAGIDVPETLVELEEALISSIRDRLGSHRKAAEDLPRRRETLRGLDAQSRNALRRLGVRSALSDLEQLRVPRPLQARVRELSQAHSGLLQTQQQTLARVEALRAELQLLTRELEALPEERDASTLAAAVERGRRAAEQLQDLQTLASRQAELQKQIARRHAALGLFDGALEALASLPLPPEGAAETFEARGQALQQRGRELQTRADDLHAAAERVARQIESLRDRGAIPTEADLQAARSERERLFAAVLAKTDAGGEGRQRYVAAVERADALADRLRREASQVAQLASALAEQDSLQRQRQTLSAQELAHAAELRELDAQWRERFAPAGIEPLSPREMTGWLKRRAELLVLHEQAQGLAAERALSQQRLSGAARALAALLGQDPTPADPGAVLPDLLRRAEDLLAEQRRLQGRHERALEDRDRLRRELAVAERAAQAATAEMDAWRADWEERMGPLQLDADASVEEAQAVLDERVELLRHAEKADELRRRIEAMVHDAEQFECDVKGLYDRHLFSLGADASTEEMAGQVVQRYLDARRDVEVREKLRAELQEAERKWSGTELRRGVAEARLGELMQLARVSEVEALQDVEQRSDSRRALEAALDDNRDELLRRGDGKALSQIEAEARGISSDEARARLQQVDTDSETLDGQRLDVVRRLTTAEHALSRFEQSEGAADAAAEAAEHLSELRELTGNYLRVRLAERLLEREMRRHREQSQGPIVDGAGQLLSRLTLGAYTGLSVDYGPDDEPALRCLKADGAEVPVSSLSDGARDQLYLALRLAALRNQAGRATPMPLLLDDILVHFDDARARATLAVLGEFAEVTQVLFFTHHERLLELSREAVAKERLVHHRLGAQRVPDGPLLADVAG